MGARNRDPSCAIRDLVRGWERSFAPAQFAKTCH